MGPSFRTVQTILFFFSFTLSSLAIPAQYKDGMQPHISNKRDYPSSDLLKTADGMFPGIDWKYSADKGCSGEQIAILMEATRMALEMMKNTGEDLRVAYDKGTGFNRYFMKHPNWFNTIEFQYASQKYFNVYNWPTTQPKRNKRQYKTVYYCIQPSWARGGCERGHSPPAYTPLTPTRDEKQEYELANSIVFCPRFWGKEFRYINDITQRKYALLDIDRLHSFEYVLIHEWFHNTKTDVGNMHQTDIKGDYGDGLRSIYGDYGCHHYAWRQVAKGGGIGDIEKTTMSNADSFAWMITYNWFKPLFNWDDDGTLRPKIQLKAREDPEATEDPNKDLPLNPDAVPDSNIPQPSSPMPESTTFDRATCKDCLITYGGCVAVPECRFPQDDMTVDPACQMCTCDISHDDNNPSTQQLALTDPKCAGFSGNLPANYKFPATPGPSDYQLKCYSPGSGTANPPSCYISHVAMSAHVADFCDKVGDLNTANLDKAYATDTYNGAQLHVSSNIQLTKNQCLEGMNRIVDGCVPASNNPLNYKYGGENNYDQTFFKINVDGGRSCHRQVNGDGSPLQAPIAKCDSFIQRQGKREELWIYGAGFVEDSFGSELSNSMNHCIGSGSVEDWSFEYYDKPDSLGMEWKAFGHIPGSKTDCVRPAIKDAGGPDIHCIESITTRNLMYAYGNDALVNIM